MPIVTSDTAAMRASPLLLVCLAVLAGCGQGAAAEDAPDAPGELAALLGSSSEGDRALDRVVPAGDERYVAPLIEVLRANEIGIPTALEQDAVVAALETLSGERFGADWGAWVTWYADTDLEPPPGFREWKGRLLAEIDGRFEQFFDPSFPSRIRVEEIVWGGVRFDGIPALDRPPTLAAGEADYLAPDDPVFGVEVNGDARAYPLRILDWHEMTNDVVGGVPVSLAYCTLCGAGVLYETQTSERTYTFGSSGFLMRSNKLMYDRQTQTLWNQLTGEPVLGPLADEKIDLAVRPLVVTTWRRWRRDHPSTRVLDVETGFDRPYENGAAYADYFSSDDPLFPVQTPLRGLDAKEQVFALRVGDAPKAYPLDEVLSRGTINDRLGGQAVAVVSSGGRVVVEGRDVQTGRTSSYQAGAEVRAFARESHRFEPAGAGVVEDERGRRWRVTESALLGPGGERAPRLGGHLAYAFGWLSYFPQSEVFGSSRRPAPAR